ncbi:MAG: hypothetical protein CL674_12400 [Bdellovibrionaceae bacterium]|nr:hypothetical protein [Pseudobdellovibrionaceae bacterium]|tara:strand:+ start:63828 stop:65312 length:1485 start_codon:yes stop_codon:yes gene_type:complete
MCKKTKFNLKVCLLCFSVAFVACGSTQVDKKPIQTQLTDKLGQDTLVAHTFTWEQGDFKKVAFKTPDYSGQNGKIGWTAETFQVPEGLRVNVDFWKNIYQKYDSHQGVLHDSFHIDLVYKEIDFHPIMRDESLSNSEKLRARRKLVDSWKDRVKVAVKKIKGKQELDDFEKEVAAKISKYTEKNILDNLPDKGRLRFQLGQKDFIKNGFFHSGLYMSQLEEIFASYDLPKELVRIAFVESSFNLRAHSKVGASGIWQIMPATARRSLPMGYYYDYRNNPIAASHTAAKLLKYNFKVLGDWPRALTAYNFGAAGMRRLSKKLGTDKIAEMSKERTGRWGFAASNFYASYLALLDTEQKLLSMYENFQVRKPLYHKEIRLKKAVNWAWLKEQIPVLEDFKDHNPQFKFSRFEGDTYLKKGLKIYGEVPVMEALNVALLKAPKIKASKFQIHRVSRGETLSNIARRYRVRMSSIASVNNLSSYHEIRIGQKLKIPVR